MFLYDTFYHKIIIFYLLTITVYVQTQENDTKCENCEPLYLTPYLEQENIQEARKLAEVHHKDFQDVKSYSGFFNVDKQFNSQMFFWYFPCVRSPDAPLVLWLEGGPGIPGFLGLFFKNGPFQFVDDKIKMRSLSWNADCNLLYIDNPVGVGFSHTNKGFSLNQTSIANNLYSTLKQFLIMFPELQKNELYILGESYGAKYTIHLSHRILHQDENDLKMNLKGFGLFSGFFDPINQLDYGENLYNLGLIDKFGLAEFTMTSNEIKKAIREEKWDEAAYKENDSSSGIAALLKKFTGLETSYNLRKPEQNMGFLGQCIETAVNYMTTNRKSLHLGNVKFDETYEAIDGLVNDLHRTAAPFLSEILNHYRGVVATGQLDIIVSYPLINNVLNNLNYSSSEEWKTAKRNQWYMNGELCGYYKTAGNLTEVLVLNSGHMIPLDQPFRAYEILYQLTNKKRGV